VLILAGGNVGIVSRCLLNYFPYVPSDSLMILKKNNNYPCHWNLANAVRVLVVLMAFSKSL